jgi:hypothetical protein
VFQSIFERPRISSATVANGAHRTQGAHEERGEKSERRRRPDDGPRRRPASGGRAAAAEQHHPGQSEPVDSDVDDREEADRLGEAAQRAAQPGGVDGLEDEDDHGERERENRGLDLPENLEVRAGRLLVPERTQADAPREEGNAEAERAEGEERRDLAQEESRRVAEDWRRSRCERGASASLTFSRTA